MKTLRYLFLWLAGGWLAPCLAVAQTPPGWAWARQFSDTNALYSHYWNSMTGLGRDAAGNLYLAGNFNSLTSFGAASISSRGETNMFVAKYDPAGSLLWVRALGSGGQDNLQGFAVTAAGKCSLHGNFGFNSASSLYSNGTLLLPGDNTQNRNYFTITLDAQGSVLTATRSRVLYDLDAMHVCHDMAGNTYVAGTCYDSLVVDGRTYYVSGRRDAVLIKYRPDGTAAWVRQVGTAGLTAVSQDLAVSPQGTVYWMVTPNDNFWINNDNSHLLKLSTNNGLIWQKNNILTNTQGSALNRIAHVDESSNTLWLYGAAFNGGTVSFASGIPALTAPANTNLSFLARCDTSAQALAVQPLATLTTNPGAWAPLHRLLPDASGFTCVMQTAIAGRTQFAGSSRVFDYRGANLPVVLHYSASGQLDWLRTGGGLSRYSTVNGAVADAAGNVYVAGAFANAAQFGTTSFTSMAPDVPDLYLAKLDQTVVAATRPAAAGLGWSLYPNPAVGSAQLDGLPATAQVRVLDALGRLVRTLPAGQRRLAGLPAGLYLLQVCGTSQPYQTQRLVVE